MYGKKLLPILRRLATRAEGQDLIEYALLVGIISIGIIAAISGLGSRIAQTYATTSAALNGTPADNGSPASGNPNTGNPGNPGGNPGNSGGNPGTPGNPGNGGGPPNNPGRGRGGG